MSFLFRNSHGIAGSLGLLALRLVVGAAFVLHGWPKIQSPMNWMGPDSPFPGWLQCAAAVSEFGGGIALALGALTPLAALGLAATMVVAIAKVHVPQGHGFVSRPGEPSFELAAGYLAATVAILLLGPGKFSVDALLFGAKASPAKRPEA